MLIAQITDLHVRPRGLPAYRVSETNRMVAARWPISSPSIPGPTWC